jgi:hypothetical protein
VLDLGCAPEGYHGCRGKRPCNRSWGDCILGFEREADAPRGVAGLDKRMGRFGQTRPPDTPLLVLLRWPLHARSAGSSASTRRPPAEADSDSGGVKRAFSGGATALSLAGLLLGRHQENRARGILAEVLGRVPEGDLKQAPLAVTANDEEIGLEIDDRLDHNVPWITRAEDVRHL